VQYERLDRAREELQRAKDNADSVVQTQLESLEGGIFEEEAGDHTQDDPGPKVDRVVEVMEKLDGLEEEADHGDVAERIGNASDLLEAYLKNHPQDE
jgi:hypothetical protein